GTLEGAGRRRDLERPETRSVELELERARRGGWVRVERDLGEAHAVEPEDHDGRADLEHLRRVVLVADGLEAARLAPVGRRLVGRGRCPRDGGRQPAALVDREDVTAE